MNKTKDALERVPKKKVEKLAAVSSDELGRVAGGGCGRSTCSVRGRSYNGGNYYRARGVSCSTPRAVQPAYYGGGSYYSGGSCNTYVPPARWGCEY